MKKNVGSTDRLIRIAIALLIIILYYTHTINGTVAVVLSMVAFIMAATSLIKFCPLYSVMGWSSKKDK